MKIDEADKIIAEYMGEVWNEGEVKPFWKTSWRSLDALTPTWKKLGCSVTHCTPGTCHVALIHPGTKKLIEVEETNATVARAAAIATAKAIKELSK